MNALISPCGQYRYNLTRHATQMRPIKSSALFCMLNPSTADAAVDDPTIRRCRGFAEDWDCNGLVVVNLYALRSTSPAGLWTHADPVGVLNDYELRRASIDHQDIVCAWGSNAREDRVRQVVDTFLRHGARLWCLGTTKAGAPRHPLYIRRDQPLVAWVPPE